MFYWTQGHKFSPMSKAEENISVFSTCMLLISESATVWLDLSPQMQGLFRVENHFFYASTPSVVSVQPKSDKT